jgi:hypothetical protein
LRAVIYAPRAGVALAFLEVERPRRAAGYFTVKLTEYEATFWLS